MKSLLLALALLISFATSAVADDPVYFFPTSAGGGNLVVMISPDIFHNLPDKTITAIKKDLLAKVKLAKFYLMSDSSGFQDNMGIIYFSEAKQPELKASMSSEDFLAAQSETEYMIGDQIADVLKKHFPKRPWIRAELFYKEEDGKWVWLAKPSVAADKTTIHYAVGTEDDSFYVQLVPAIPIDRDKMENRLLKIKHVGQATVVKDLSDTVIALRAKTTKDALSKDWNLDSIADEVIKVLQKQMKGFRFEKGTPAPASAEDRVN